MLEHLEYSPTTSPYLYSSVLLDSREPTQTCFMCALSFIHHHPHPQRIPSSTLSFSQSLKFKIFGEFHITPQSIHLALIRVDKDLYRAFDSSWL